MRKFIKCKKCGKKFEKRYDDGLFHYCNDCLNKELPNMQKAGREITKLWLKDKLSWMNQ